MSPDLALPKHDLCTLQEAAAAAPVKPRESEAQKQQRLNNEIKENVTKILLDVTDTLFGGSLLCLLASWHCSSASHWAELPESPDGKSGFVHTGPCT